MAPAEGWEVSTDCAPYWARLKKRNGQVVQRLHLSLNEPFSWEDYKANISIEFFATSTLWAQHQPTIVFKIPL